MRHAPLPPAFALSILLGLLVACAPPEPGAASSASSAALDRAAAARVALDTLSGRWRAAQMIDSVVWRGDTAEVWIGPRDWMATDRPTTAVSILPPSRVVAVRHVPGG
jgi:hypothetical protein